VHLVIERRLRDRVRGADSHEALRILTARHHHRDHRLHPRNRIGPSGRPLEPHGVKYWPDQMVMIITGPGKAGHAAPTAPSGVNGLPGRSQMTGAASAPGPVHLHDRLDDPRSGQILDLPQSTEHIRRQVRGDDTSPRAFAAGPAATVACKAINILQIRETKWDKRLNADVNARQIASSRSKYDTAS